MQGGVGVDGKLLDASVIAGLKYVKHYLDLFKVFMGNNWVHKCLILQLVPNIRHLHFQIPNLTPRHKNRYLINKLLPYYNIKHKQLVKMVLNELFTKPLVLPLEIYLKLSYVLMLFENKWVRVNAHFNIQLIDSNLWLFILKGLLRKLVFCCCDFVAIYSVWSVF